MGKENGYFDPAEGQVIVSSSHGEYLCDTEGNVLDEIIYQGGDHRPGQRLRFEWPGDVTQGVDILACIEHHADGTVVPRDDDFMQEIYYGRGGTSG